MIPNQDKKVPTKSQEQQCKKIKRNRIVKLETQHYQKRDIYEQ